jgi:hypothetical protein
VPASRSKSDTFRERISDARRPVSIANRYKTILVIPPDAEGGPSGSRSVQQDPHFFGREGPSFDLSVTAEDLHARQIFQRIGRRSAILDHPATEAFAGYQVVTLSRFGDRSQIDCLKLALRILVVPCYGRCRSLGKISWGPLYISLTKAILASLMRIGVIRGTLMEYLVRRLFWMLLLLLWIDSGLQRSG